jgi:diguanylate cyclase (GGDEF)-like protein
MREIERVRRIGQTAKFSFFNVSSEDELMCWFENKIPENDESNNLILLQNTVSDNFNERFTVIADAHFSALLVAVNSTSGLQTEELQVIYTFDPDVVYTALEYLQARFAVEHPAYSDIFMQAIHRSMPKATSLPLTLAVTTKLAGLWQEQTGREIAVNRISTAIRQWLELDQILQIAVNEVSAALNVEQCVLLIESEEDPSFSVVYCSEELIEDGVSEVKRDLEAFKQRLRNTMQPYVRDGISVDSSSTLADAPQSVVPLSFLNQFIGVLSVQSKNLNRIWQESDLLLLQTVADQVAVAIKHARLYIKSRQEALRDSLTGAFNRRYFELQFEREFKLAERQNQNFAIIMVDIDKFKKINDTYGHQIGDKVLRHIANALNKELRAFDTVMRYGGEEFAVILSQVGLEESFVVAERLRQALETLEIQEVKKVTASFGVAVYPECGKTMDSLLTAADQALYEAKRKGRNRVCLAAQIENPSLDETSLDESIATVTN